MAEGSDVRFRVTAWALGLGGDTIEVDFDSESSALKMFEAVSEGQRFDVVTLQRLEVLTLEEWRRPLELAVDPA